MNEAKQDAVRQEEINAVADAIAEEQACGSCADTTPLTRHCASCESEAVAAIRALNAVRASSAPRISPEAIAEMRRLSIEIASEGHPDTRLSRLIEAVEQWAQQPEETRS